MKQGRNTLLILTGIFLLCELIFNYFVMVEGDGDVLGITAKTVFFLLFILLFSKKLVWAKWILSVTMILYGILSFLIGFEFPVFLIVGLYEIFFGVYIHKSKALAVFREQDSVIEDIAQPSEGVSNDAIEVLRQHVYPLLLRRVQALFIDGMLILLAMIVIMLMTEGSELQASIMIASAALLSNYEPLLTAYSRTPGQRVMKIRVGRYNNPSERISVLNAYVRWLVKGLLGWISFITIHFNPERRAIHDLAGDSVMVREVQSVD